MSADAARLGLGCPFWYLAKFEGDRPQKSDSRSDYERLQSDLSDPQCVEIITGGDGLPTQVWRK